MSKKEQLWHQRMGSTLDARIMTAGMLWVAANPAYDGTDEDEDEMNRRAEVENYSVRQESLSDGSAGPAMTLGEAEELHGALRMALDAAGEKPLGIIDATALKYLGHLLDCEPIAEFRFGVSTMFESGNITYTGAFEKLRERMVVGVSFQNATEWLGGLPVRDVALEVRQIRDLTFDRGQETDSDLKTVRVSGSVEFTVIVRGEEAPKLDNLTNHITVVLDPRQSPAPVQRMPMRYPLLTSEEIR